MKVGIWSDSHNFLPLVPAKLSAYHKSLGHCVDLYSPLDHYDVVYASKVFSFTADIDDDYPVNADCVIRGGTGYCINVIDGVEVFDFARNVPLPSAVECIYPDYDLFPQFCYAAGFLTRGCPRGCPFCHVGSKEGLLSHQVADLSDFWRGQKEIKLLDPNLLACRDRDVLLRDLALSGAKVDFTQGLDIRLIDPDIARLINNIRSGLLHFAWDLPSFDLAPIFTSVRPFFSDKSDRDLIVYVLVNYNSTLDDDLRRVYVLRDIGYTPYIMVYDKSHAAPVYRRLQRWVNNRFIFRSCYRFEDYRG